MVEVKKSHIEKIVDEPSVSEKVLLKLDLRKKAEAYIQPGETVVGFGYGGSESLTIFIENESGTKYVRKVLSEELITPSWDRNGKDVMMPPFIKAKSQYEFLRGLPKSAGELFPRVFGEEERVRDIGDKKVFEYIYDMSFVDGIEVSKFIRDYRPSPRLVAYLYCEIFRCLAKDVHASKTNNIGTNKTLEQSYFKKIEDRLNLSRKTSPNLFGGGLMDSPLIKINGVYYKNVNQLLDIFRNESEFQSILEPDSHCLVMGDTNTENIKIENINVLLDLDRSGDFDFKSRPVTSRDMGLKFLDPRAIGFHVDGADTGVDDPMYDNKPWHNSLGNYDHIHGEHFDVNYAIKNGIPNVDISIHQSSPYNHSYKNINNYFPQVMSILNEEIGNHGIFQKGDYWIIRFAFVMGTHFMAMPPFHFNDSDDDYIGQKRALAIYCEGVKWLNYSLDILNKKVDTFLGVKVPVYDQANPFFNL